MNELTPQMAVQVLVGAGWSEARIAREIGTSQPTVHRIKRGHQGAAYTTVKRLMELAAREPATGEQPDSQTDAVATHAA